MSQASFKSQVIENAFKTLQYILESDNVRIMILEAHLKQMYKT